MFNNNVTGFGSVTSSCSKAGVKVDPDDAHQRIVTVGSSHCNAQTITVTVSNVTDDQGKHPRQRLGQLRQAPWRCER